MKLFLEAVQFVLLFCMRRFFVPCCVELYGLDDDDLHRAGLAEPRSVLCCSYMNTSNLTESGNTWVDPWELSCNYTGNLWTLYKMEPNCTHRTNTLETEYSCTRCASENVRDQKTKRKSTRSHNENIEKGRTQEEKANNKHYYVCKCRMSDKIQSWRFTGRASRIVSGGIGLLLLGNRVSEHTWQDSSANRPIVLSESRSLTVFWSTKYSKGSPQTMRYLRRFTDVITYPTREAASPVNPSDMTRNKTVASTCECESGSGSDEGDEVAAIDGGTLCSLVIGMLFLKVISRDLCKGLLVRKSAGKTEHRLENPLRNEYSQASDSVKDFFHWRMWAESALKDEESGLGNPVSPLFMACNYWKRTSPLGVFTNLWVAPVARFLPSVFSHESNHLDHEGYRLASLAALPTSCTLSRVRLAAAGFHFDPRKDINAVVCHKCGAILSLGYSSQECTPLAYHHQASPNCQFLKDMLDTFTDAPASLSFINSGSTPASQDHTGSLPSFSTPRMEAANVHQSFMEPSSMESSTMSSLSSSLASSSLSPPSLGSTDSSLNKSSLGSASSLSPSSLSSARTSLATSSLSSRSTPSMNSNTTSSLGTSDLGSLSSMSFSSESSLTSASTVSGFSSLPTMPTGTFGATASSIRMTATAGGDQTDSRSDLMTDDAEASPETTQAPWQSTTRQEGQQQATTTRTGYFLALPSTAQDVPSASVFPRRDSPTMAQGSNPRADDSPTPTLDIAGAVYPQFGTTHSRLATFTNWPQALARLFPASFMVTIGFYYAGYADCVRCFYCGVGLKTWYEEDDALVEHIRWRPNCQYILATKGKQFVQDTLARINNPSATNSQAHALRSSSAVPVMQTVSSQSNPQAGQETNRSGSPRPVQNQTPQQPPRAPSQSETVSRAPRQGDPAMIDHLQNMGFSTEAISRAMAQILAWGRPPSLQNMLDLLLGGHE